MGKKWNGKGYNKRGIIDFEIRNGNGLVKEYNSKGEIEFEGEYLNGEKSGKGKEYNNLILVFEGISYIMSLIISSIIERSPLAPVFLSIALSRLFANGRTAVCMCPRSPQQSGADG